MRPERAEIIPYQGGKARFYPSRLAYERVSGQSRSAGRTVPVGHAGGTAGAVRSSGGVCPVLPHPAGAESIGA